ncbi:MAG: hypothetical protein HYW78_02915 [Parcubacteria group bacterium]|nr:hypothetical protein [Parcubacteria group bacterium]
MNTKITVIGGGRIGAALVFLLKKYHPSLWDIDASKMSQPITIENALENARVIFLCVPSWCLRSCVLTILKYKRIFSSRAIFISLSKGIENTTFKTADEILAELFASYQYSYGLLFGPMLAEELIHGLPGAAIFATKNESSFRLVKNLFKNTPLIVDYSVDTHGVALAGILKNIYAFLMGVIEATKPSDNARGILMQKIINEMSAIHEFLGGKPETLKGYAGFGDFFATALSHHSANRTLGETIMKNKKPLAVSEGYSSILPFVKLLKKKNAPSFPLCALVAEIVKRKYSAHRIRAAILKNLRGNF